jgi:hypothetical protein
MNVNPTIVVLHEHAGVIELIEAALRDRGVRVLGTLDAFEAEIVRLLKVDPLVISRGHLEVAAIRPRCTAACRRSSPTSSRCGSTRSRMPWLRLFHPVEKTRDRSFACASPASIAQARREGYGRGREWQPRGNFRNAFLRHVGVDSIYAPAQIPLFVFIAYQMMFAIITPALITGAFSNRVTFRA